ncbi:hypothetical protein [Mucilaginibacter aquatilis]|uniref:Type IX secretion system membrane protein PorP/SprF n=1 Tax=Mucilaginibacter aquatilis TaxID=1517760 RepID=A0A6I4I3K0_9SPHI|nr:hypothetical protein [Mucilaginibacter aquatilis]MVN89712.1 hypothetical protein [Mucilaginibacter aquatilis]
MAKRIFFITSLLCLLFGFDAYCGWPTRPRRLILSPSYSYFTANKDWDSVGRKVSRPNNGTFRSHSVSLYAEYGIVRRLAAIGTLPFLSYNIKDDTGRSFGVSGFGDMELGLKYYLANIGYKYYFTLQGTGIVPLYKTEGLGFAQGGGELRLGLSGAGNIGKSFYSLSLENAVRKYLGDNGPIQDRYSASFGITLDKKFHDQLSVSVSGVLSKSDFTAFTRNIYTARDFTFTQVSLSYGHTFNNSFSIFLTGGRFITGRNTTIATNASVAFIYKIDNFLGRKIYY